MKVKIGSNADYSMFDRFKFKVSKKAREKALDRAKYVNDLLVDQFTEELSKGIIGVQAGQVNYSGTLYADIDYTKEIITDERTKTYAKYVTDITAFGKDLYFIEFGTGIYYDDDHPWKDEAGAVRGSYGKGQGNNPYWFFTETKGVTPFVEPAYSKGRDKNGDIIPNNNPNLYISRGNPANQIVYKSFVSTKQLLEQLGGKRSD